MNYDQSKILADFINYCKSFGSVSKDLPHVLSEYCSITYLKKGEFFLKAGQFSNKQGFLIDGVMRHFFYNKENKDCTTLFLVKNDLVGDIENCVNGNPSQTNIQAIADCIILSIDAHNDKVVTSRCSEWGSISNLIGVHFLNSVIERKNFMLQNDATTNYNYFIKSSPGLLNQVPLRMIASYLGVTQQSLSRLRKQK